MADEVPAKVTVALNERIEKRARGLHGSGFDPMDALHLAYAEEAKADYFCTCDDRLLKRVKAFPGFTVRAMLPIELAQEIVK